MTFHLKISDDFGNSYTILWWNVLNHFETSQDILNLLDEQKIKIITHDHNVFLEFPTEEDAVTFALLWS